MMTQSPSCEFIRPDPQAVRQLGDFRHSFAVLMGVTEYGNERICLRTPVNDVEDIAGLLRSLHGYHTSSLTRSVTVDVVEQIFTCWLPEIVGKDDRLLIYFAGHGIAKDDDTGPNGYLLFSPSVDDPTRPGQLRMAQLYDWLKPLACRHLLLILDCCFAGAFRWSSTRNLVLTSPILYKERFARFLRAQAWQVLTSAAHNQQALDVFPGDLLGARSMYEGNGYEERLHSPFAASLLEALQGKADRDAQDNVITATKLYLYLRDAIEPGVEETARHLQTPGLWPLARHESGEYIFLVPNRDAVLPSDPQLDAANNPWRGLSSYDEEHQRLFFGRKKVTEALKEQVETHLLIPVLGASGSGKSSVVKAGLLPLLRGDSSNTWQVMEPIRPTGQPLHRLTAALNQLNVAETLNAEAEDFDLQRTIRQWCDAHPTRKLLLVIDQFEELVTETKVLERKHFLAALVGVIEAANGALHVVVTLRSDFESYFDDDELLKPYWKQARTLIPSLTQDDLRDVIEGPATEKAVYFDSPELVNAMINDVLLNPGALPLLSFTLSELYLRYIKEGRADRTLTKEGYKQIGGVAGSLRRRIEEVYQNLCDDAHRDTMRRVALRMVSFEGGEATRRRVMRHELEYPSSEENQRVATVLKELVDARLLVTSSDKVVSTVYIEPAHDRLVHTWSQLLEWYKEAASVVLVQRRVSVVAYEWEHAAAKDGKAPLWTNDPRLSQLHQVLAPQDYDRTGWPGRFQRIRRGIFPTTAVPKEPTLLNDVETRFVQASVTARARSVQRTILLSILIMAVLVGGSGLIWALRQEAARQRDSSLAADSGRLAEEALQLVRADPATAVQKSLSALPSVVGERPYVPYAEYALSEALQGSQERQRLLTEARAPSEVAIGETSVAVAASQLVRLGRIDEAVSLATRHLRSAQALTAFADEVLGRGDATRQATIIALVDDHLWENEGKNTTDDQVLRSWLERRYVELGQPAKALELAEERFKASPTK
ncbi:MAG: hypothetical protein DCC55_34240, partial [Chloroflexi bacterium]